MILTDQDELSDLNLQERIMSQCILVTPEIINNVTGTLSRNAVIKFASIIGWLNRRAIRAADIPFAEAEHGYLPDIVNKWAMEQTSNGILVWISDKEVRTEFVLTWL